MASTSLQDFVRYVEHAARQRLRLVGRQEDLVFQRAGGVLIYSIDTDIVMLFMEPSQRSIRGTGRSRRHGYAQIFPDDPDELSIALGTAIAEFIFFALGAGATPVLMLPPLEHEVADLFYGLARAASGEHRRWAASLEEAEKALTVLEKEDDGKRRLAAAIAAIPRLRPFLFASSGPSMALSRLSALMTGSDFAALDSVLAREESTVDDATLARLRRPETLRDWLSFSALLADWRQRLRGTKSRGAAAKTVEADCRALARLEFMNGLAPTKLRIVHVTGDSAIHAAAAEYWLDGDTQSFGTKYLRDPRAFLAEPRVLFGDDGGGQHGTRGFTEWLDVFLGTFTGSADISPEALMGFLRRGLQERGRIVEDALRTYPQAEADFALRWQQFCGPVTLKKHGDSTAHGRLTLGDTLAGEVASGAGPVERLRVLLRGIAQEVEEQVRQTWEACFNVATATGFSLLHLGGGGMRARHRVPLIAFANFKRAAGFFEDMLRNDGGSEYRERLVELREADPYQYYLAFAALFAANAKWHVADILAGQALETVKSVPRVVGEGQVSGREAFYLRAMARRVTAGQPGDFERSEADLEQARRALAWEKEVGGNDDEVRVGELRFAVEDLERDLGRWLWEWAVVERAQEGEEVPGELSRRALELAGRADGELKGGVYEYMRRPMRCAVLADCCVGNVFMRPGGRGEESMEEARGLLVALEAELADGFGSYFEKSMRVVMEAVVVPCSDLDEARDRRAAIENQFMEEAVVTHAVTAYDRALLGLMRRRTLENLRTAR